MEVVKPHTRSVPEKNIILAITIFYTVVFIYSIIKDHELLWWSLSDFTAAPLDGSIYLFPYLLLPVAIIYFGKRKTIGWILLVIFITYTAVVMLIELGRLISWYYGSQEPDYLLFSDSVPIADIVQLILLIITLLIIGKARIRHIYYITSKTMGITIFLSTLLAILLTIVL